MGYNGANFVFRGNGSVSPFGTTFSSGSYVGQKEKFGGGFGAVRNNLSIDIANYNSCNSNYVGGCGGGIFDLGYGTGMCGMDMYGMDMFGGGGCCHSGIDDKGAGLALGIGFGVGVLASPIGGSIIRGIGTGFKYMGKGLAWCGRGIGKAASWTWNTLLKPAGIGIGKGIGKAASWTWNNLLKPVGQGVGNFFKGCWNFITGKGWSGDKA